jgi:hypothetical protein
MAPEGLGSAGIGRLAARGDFDNFGAASPGRAAHQYFAVMDFAVSGVGGL